MSTLDQAMNYIASNVKSYKHKVLGSDVSLTSGTCKALLSLTLEPGIWIITAAVRADGNAGGYRLSCISTTSASIGTGDATKEGYMQQWTNGSGYQCNCLSRIVQIDSNTTYYLNHQQSATGTAQARQTHISAVRVL